MLPLACHDLAPAFGRKDSRVPIAIVEGRSERPFLAPKKGRAVRNPYQQAFNNPPCMIRKTTTENGHERRRQAIDDR